MRGLVFGTAVATLTLLAAAAFAATPVDVSHVRIEVKEKTLGKDKGTKYVRVFFTAAVKDAVPKGMTIQVHGSCRSDVRSKEGAIDALGAKLETLAPGDTKALEVPLFINDGFHVKPHTCDLVFRYGKMGTRVGAKVGSFCWSGGVTKEGVCE